MKQFLTLLSVILCSNLLAQNWQPVTLNEVYNFEYSVDDEICTIKVDSVEVQGSDSIFYLNRVALPCDTCTGEFEYAYLKNQPQFLMRQMMKSGTEDGVYTFSDTLEFTIKTLSNEGDTWDFLPSQGITAEVIEVSIQEVLGVEDNIKIIELSNGQTFTISENHGIISFPDFYSEGEYNLVGMETSEQGYSIPDFWDFYDFQIGDVYQYVRHSWHTASNPGSNDTYRKVTIEQKDVYPTYYEYSNVQVGHVDIFNGYGMPVDTMYFEDVVNKTYTESDHPIANGYNNELLNLDGYLTGLIEGQYGIVNFEYQNNAVYRKSLYSPEENYTWYTIANEYNPQAHEDLILPSMMDGFQKVYEVNKGIVFDVLGMGEFHEEEQLIGSIIDGETTGTVYSDSWLLTVNKNKSMYSGVKCFPNPTSSSLTISLEDPSPVISYRIYNSIGQTEEYKRVNLSQNEITINLNHIKAGIYVVEAETQNGTVKRVRFVKL